ncbi:MAG: helix-turn-helix domain-containing protein [Holophaga sp.]|nr:helix-turn-helix domain-containing protein [Holophaga sp.]
MKPHSSDAKNIKGMVEPYPLAYCVENTAKVLGIGRTFVFQLIKEGKLKAVKIGRRTLIPVVEAEAFLSRQGGAA